VVNCIIELLLPLGSLSIGIRFATSRTYKPTIAGSS
jgi:hypothetical protein